jgi:hypothetical protein
MGRLTWPRVIAVAVGIGLFSWGVNVLVVRAGGSPLPVPWTVPVLLVMVAGVALVLGWTVRQFQAGKRPSLDPFRAARTAMFAQAAALTGAALIGVYGGCAAAIVAQWGHPPRRHLAIVALVAVAASAVLLAAGWIAERWCATSGGEGTSSKRSPEAA